MRRRYRWIRFQHTIPMGFGFRPAGGDFEERGDESPTVSRRKDKAKVKSLTLEMYEKAVLYYSKAQETGYPEAAERIAAVKEKMATLAQ